MTDFDFIKLILNKRYLCKGDEAMVMKEDQGTEYKPHTVRINAGATISQIALYRFDEADKGDFFPFFNSSHHKPKHKDDAPKGLRSFCDYILLAEKRGVAYVVLVEMKRGTTDGAEQQLEAGYEFMSFVMKSAERIKRLNNVPDFNLDNIVYRRVLLKLPVSPKLRTRPGDIRIEDRDGIIVYTDYATFNLNRIL